jgi:uncharacterized protein
MLLTYFLITFGILVACLMGMALGVIFSNKPLKGSCGGLGRIMGKSCEICGKKEECQKRKQAAHL